MKSASNAVQRCFIAFLLAILSDTSPAETYTLPEDGSDVVGSVATVIANYDDTLVDIARRHGVGYEDMVRANPDVNVWVPGEGTEVLIPTHFVLPAVPRKGIVLNLAEYRLYYFPEPNKDKQAVVMTFPISIGRQDWETPLGLTRVISKAVNPHWYPPESVRKEHAADGRPLPKIVPPGPDNPLGKRAMRLDLPGYLIHGTNRPAGVGMRVTHGCLRMFPENIEFLFDLVAVDTPVRIINEPVKIGWQGERLVMEVHPLLESAAEKTVDEPQPDTVSESSMPGGTEPSDPESSDPGPNENASEATTPPAEEKALAGIIDVVQKDPLTYVTEQFIVATGERPGQLDWALVESVVARADGMPVIVGESIKNAATSAAFE